MVGKDITMLTEIKEVLQMKKFKITLPNEDPKNVGKRIALLRNEKGLTQLQLAEKMNVSRSLIASIESGAKTPDLRLWASLSIFFGVSSDYIAGTSTNRAFKTFSGCVKIDPDKLSPRERDVLYTVYSSLLSNSEYRNEL